MTFPEALKTGRPMRRQWSIVSGPWLYLGRSAGLQPQPLWRRIDSGDAVGLDVHDYLATDWEVMP